MNRIKARIQKEPIDVKSLIEATRNADSGAIVTFQGTVRRFSVDTEVSSLHYEAYEEMALKKMDEIMKDTVSKFSVLDVNIIHRIGDVNLKEDSVAIVVSSPHRKEAFQACEFVIDSIKESVPIWKMDITPEGRKIWHE